jgi:hypothetical protein
MGDHGWTMAQFDQAPRMSGGEVKVQVVLRGPLAR